MSAVARVERAITLPIRVAEPASPKVTNAVVTTLHQAAAYLTDPICTAHEYFRRMQVVDTLHPESHTVTNLMRKVGYVVGMAGWIGLALFATVPGICLRTVASGLQEHPFLYAQGTAPNKTLPNNRAFSLLSWNICCPAGGYPISNGGVEPWVDRIDAIVDKICATDADVNCIYETMDAKVAFYLCEKLKQNGYTHIYYNMGARGIGVQTGILVASKYNIQKPEFTPFPLDALIGRTKHCAKGVFAFDLESEGHRFARVFTTHLQQSVAPQFTTAEEIEARRKQMEIIMGKISAVQGRCVVLTGDLNLDDEEHRASFWHPYFQKGDRFTDKTWDGDEFCATLVGDKVSCALNLDHTMVLNGTARSLETTLIETGFDPKVYKRGALSDHRGLLSKITVTG